MAAWTFQSGFTVTPFIAFDVQGGRSFGCLPVTPLHRYTVTPFIAFGRSMGFRVFRVFHG